MGLWNRIVQKMSKANFQEWCRRGGTAFMRGTAGYTIPMWCVPVSARKQKAIGKAVAKHIRTTRTQEGSG